MNRKNLVVLVEAIGLALLMFNFYIWPSHVFIQMFGCDLIILGLLLIDTGWEWFNSDAERVIARFIIFIFLVYYGVFSLPMLINVWNTPASTVPFNIIGILIGLFSYIILVWMVMKCVYEVSCFIAFLLRRREAKEEIVKQTVPRYPTDSE